ncbi:MAG: TIGR00730 family Rossman fold protein [Planctomycetota bacterium]
MPMICVYASSSLLLAPEVYAASERLGTEMARQGWDLIFGGSNVGLMDVVARAMQAGGRRVVSVIPEIFAERNLTYVEADEVVVTPDLRQRKQIMQERADAFCVFPGGPGTLDEFYETLTLVQIRAMEKPILLLNWEDHFAGTLSQIAAIEAGGYSRVPLGELFRVAADEAEARRELALMRDALGGV